MPAPQPPTPAALRAFGAVGALEALGRRSWRCGDVVLTLVRDVGAAVAVARVLARLPMAGVRVPPWLDGDGSVVVDGWAAHAHVPGGVSRDWGVVRAAGDALHAALAGVAVPDDVTTSTAPHAVADRMAWGEEPLVVQRPELRLLAMLFGASVGGAPAGRQLIHDGLADSVIVTDGVPEPTIVGLPMLARPPAYASALMAVDAIGWYDAGTDVAHAVPATSRVELLARAALHRLLTADAAASAGLSGEEATASVAGALGRVYDVVAGLD